MKRIPIILFLLTAGCGQPAPVAQPEAPAVKTQAEWDQEYRDDYRDADRANKPKILQRIVDLEIAAHNTEEAKVWIRIGIDDKRDVVYTDAPGKELFADVVKERADAKAAAPAAEMAAKEKKAREAKEAADAAEAKRKADAETPEAIRAKIKEVEADYAKLLKDNNATDVKGLVLLGNTVTDADEKGSITGYVVNQRGRTVKYAQISFNLYDADGAQIGSALANINGLEAGGKWHFKASTFGKRFASYKFSELSGF